MQRLGSLCILTFLLYFGYDRIESFILMKYKLQHGQLMPLMKLNIRKIAEDLK